MPPQPKPDLRQLLSEAREGEGGSLGQLLEHYRNYLYLVARTQIDLHLAVRANRYVAGREGNPDARGLRAQRLLPPSFATIFEKL